jgi:hypothetical protein
MKDAPIATVRRYMAAFQSLDSQGKLKDEHKAMLAGHFYAPGHLLSTSSLSAAAGRPPKPQYANSAYGTLGRWLSAELGYRPPTRKSDGKPIQTMALAVETSATTDDGHFQWHLRPEVAQALIGLGWVDDTSRSNPINEIRQYAGLEPKEKDTERER